MTGGAAIWQLDDDDDSGNDPDIDAYTLGKRVVDDFYEFYESGEGKGQEGTLAVVDTKALMESEFIDHLSEMTGVLKQQAAAKLFYDEYSSARNAIRYGTYMNYFDLGNLASLISVVNMEVKKDEQGEITTDNAYTGAKIT